MNVMREIRDALRASPIFAFYVLVTLVLGGFIGLLTFQSDLFPGMRGMNHFGDPSHRVHDLSYGFLFTTGMVGVLAQLRRPVKNVAGMVMALIPGAGLLLAAVLAADAQVVVGNPLRSATAVTVIVALLHPTGRGFFHSFRVSRPDRAMLALVGLAAVPLLGFASTNLRLQRTVLDMHAIMGHYGFMAALSFTVVGVGLLASLRPEGWRLTAWMAGLLPALLGIISLIYPSTSSSLSPGWAFAAVAWGVVFVAVAERSRAAARSLPVEHPPVASGSVPAQ